MAEGAGRAIVVLGAAVREGGVASPTLARRARAGAALWRPGARLVLTGGAGRHGPAEAVVAAEIARAAGVPAAALVVEARSTTTLGNLVESRALLAPAPPAEVVIVSDWYHLPRAVLAARLLGLPAHGHAAPRGRGAAALLRQGRGAAREALAMPATLLRAVGARRRPPG